MTVADQGTSSQPPPTNATPIEGMSPPHFQFCSYEPILNWAGNIEADLGAGPKGFRKTRTVACVTLCSDMKTMRQYGEYLVDAANAYPRHLARIERLEAALQKIAAEAPTRVQVGDWDGIAIEQIARAALAEGGE